MLLTVTRRLADRVFIIILIICHLSLTHTEAQMRQIYTDANPNNQIQKLCFYSPNEGYVAFQDGAGYTTDSGRSYLKKKITLSNVNYNGYYPNLTFGFGINGVKAFDRNTLIVYGDYGLVPSILYSTDGGNTFKLIYNSQFNPSQLRTGIMDMVFPQNDNIGYAVDADRILKTTDKGQTWTVVRSDPGSYFSFLESIDDNTVFTFSTDYNSRKLLRSVDGGASWQQITIPAGQIRYAGFVSPDKGWLQVTPDGSPTVVYYTSNGGTSWSQKNGTLGTYFQKMKFLNDSTGFAAVGFDVYKTSDSGKVWEPLRRDNSFSYLGYGINDLQIFGSQLWAGGGHGFLQLGTQFGGTPVPKAYFSIDTSNFYFTGVVHGINLSKPAYQYKWFVNNVLVSQSYNLTYTHSGYPLADTIRLQVSNGVYADSAVHYQHFYAPLTLSSFLPATAGAGTVVTITGKNLSGANFVSFGGTPAASINSITDTSIKATVGPGASGDIVVATSVVHGSIPGFTFIPPPAITSFSPATGAAGNPVTITGANFTGATAVAFGGTPVYSFTLVSPTRLIAYPASGSSGSITVITPGGTAISATSFVELPVITQFSPTHGTSGTILTITGTGLNGATAVSIGGMAPRSDSIPSSTTIICTLARGATGAVTVTTPGGTASLAGFTYFPPPVITSFSPASGPIGTRVTITGSNFSPVPANNTVYFGAVTASVVAATPTSLTVIVPAGATYQPVSVTTNTYTAYSTFPFLVTFPNGGSITAHSFAPPIYLPTGTGYSNTTSVAVGDLDGDGKPDLAASNLANGSISVIRNTGTPGSPSFAPKVDYTVGSEPDGVWMIDIDGDGKLDLVTSVTSDQKISIQRNTSVPGAISFAPVVELTGVMSAQAVIAIDIDGDGRPDLVSSKSVFLNKSEAGNISFYPKFDYNSSAGAETSVTDIDGDGKPDLIVVSATGNKVTVFRNISTNGVVAFGAPLDLATISPNSVATGDIDGDGKPDIAVVDGIGTTISLFRNTSSGSISFDKRIDLPGTHGPVRVRLCDMDGDGQLDMLVASLTDAKVTVYKNISHPGLPAFSPGIDFSTGTLPMALAGADIDLDGKNDIVTTGNNTGLSILRNTVVAEPFVATFTPTTAEAGTAITITGRNFAGASNVSFGGVPATSFTIISDTSINAIIGAGSTGDVTVTNTYGQAARSGFTFGLVPVITSFSPLSGPVGTILTISGRNFNPADTNNLVTIGGIKATILSSTDHSFTVTVPAGMAWSPVTVTTHHFTAYSQASFITTFPGAGSNFNSHSFGPRNDYPGGGSGCIADLDGDGKMDIICINGSNTISVSRNTSSPRVISFAPGLNVTTGANPIKQACGDLDGDGKPDIVTITGPDYSFSVLRNTSSPGALSFAPKIDFGYAAGSINDADDIAVEDLDGDGRPDVVVTNYHHILSVFHNTTVNGVISFTRQDYETGGYATGVAISDLDNDGKKDITLSVNGSSGIAVFKNISQPGTLSFATRVDIPITGNWPASIKAGDLDGDGKPDLIITLENSNKLAILRNNSSPGSIVFAAEMDFPAGNEPSTIAPGDLDGDGRIDLSIHNRFIDYYSPNRIISVAKNVSSAGNIAVQAKVDYSLRPSTGPAGTSIADIDGDGKPDLISYGNYNSIFRNQVGESSIASFTPAVGTNGTSVTIKGSGFTGATSVSFGGIPASSFTLLSDTSIIAVVGPGAGGSVTIAKPADTLALGGFIFVPTPSIAVIGPLQFCQGGSDTLRSSASFGNRWFRNGVAITDTSATIVTGDAGLYTLTTSFDSLTTAPSAPVQLTVNPIPPKPIIIVDASGLVSSADSGNQWYIDTTTIITGATGKHYSPSAKGSYTTRVTNSGCASRFSDPYSFVPPVPDTSGQGWQIAPNPATDYIRITYTFTGVNRVSVEIFDFNGRVLVSLSSVKSGDKISVAALPGGYYLLKIASADGRVNATKEFWKF